MFNPTYLTVTEHIAAIVAVPVPTRGRPGLAHDATGREVDDRLGPFVPLLSSWNIDKSPRPLLDHGGDLWTLRRTSFLRDRFLESLGHTVGMTSRALLTPNR